MVSRKVVSKKGMVIFVVWLCALIFWVGAPMYRLINEHDRFMSYKSPLCKKERDSKYCKKYCDGCSMYSGVRLYRDGDLIHYGVCFCVTRKGLQLSEASYRVWEEECFRRGICINTRRSVYASTEDEQ